MAVAAAIEVAELAAEAVAETAAETIAETTAEAAAEGAAEAAAEGAAEMAAEAAAENGSRDSGGNCGGNCGRDGRRNGGRMKQNETLTNCRGALNVSAPRPIYIRFRKQESIFSGVIAKVVKIGAILVVGVAIGSVIDLIKGATGAGLKKCKLDADTRKSLEKVQNALDQISGMFSRWNGVLKGLGKDVDLGSIEVDLEGKKESIHVSSLFYGVLDTIKKDLDKAQAIAKECSESCAWQANLQVFTLHIVNAVTDMVALVDLRDKSSKLQQYNVPASTDKGTLQQLLDSDFPKWKEYIKQQAKKHLNTAMVKEAKENATKAVLPIVKQPIQTQVLAQAKSQVVPPIVNASKDEGKRAAKRVFDDRRGHIMAIGLIPFYGWVKSQQLIADAKRDAINNARNAARNKANQEFGSPAVQDKMHQISKSVSDSVFAQHKTQVDQAIKSAVDSTMAHYKPVHAQLDSHMDSF
ncbi:predicted protein [Nematostella vectensis]|uniref:Uncharacterized protein n=1 Tax=Nematostella vectensis TaxID=45351 RepID=A7S0Z4_NEMVE|nr:predicted protein [Nematostella vectensis]|eukprot:XP_001634731.1 predicted protein [Nematostella vectensis]